MIRFSKSIAALVASGILTACATAGKDVASSYVSPMQYANYDCDQLRAESMRISGRVNQLTGRLDEAASKFLNVAAARLGWSARATHRTLKVARTIADLAGSIHTQVTHVAEAMQYRRALRGH